MCKNKCCNNNRCNPCTPKLRYCGEELECIDVLRGDSFDEALSNINDVICNISTCNLSVELIPQNIEGTNFTLPQTVVSGGTAPYAYKWTLQQTGGNPATINPAYETLSTFPGVDGLNYPDGECSGSLSTGIPCRISYANIDTDFTHAMNYKLTVTDANGCKAFDYWTMYYVYTY